MFGWFRKIERFDVRQLDEAVLQGRAIMVSDKVFDQVDDERIIRYSRHRVKYLIPNGMSRRKVLKIVEDLL